MLPGEAGTAVQPHAFLRGVHRDLRAVRLGHRHRDGGVRARRWPAPRQPGRTASACRRRWNSHWSAHAPQLGVLPGREFWLLAAQPALRPRDRHALPGPHPQQIDLELGEDGEDVEEHLPHRVSGVVRAAGRVARWGPARRCCSERSQSGVPFMIGSVRLAPAIGIFTGPLMRDARGPGDVLPSRRGRWVRLGFPLLR